MWRYRNFTNHCSSKGSPSVYWSNEDSIKMEDPSFMSLEAGFPTLCVWTLSTVTLLTLWMQTQSSPALEEYVWKVGKLPVPHAREVNCIFCLLQCEWAIVLLWTDLAGKLCQMQTAWVLHHWNGRCPVLVTHSEEIVPTAETWCHTLQNFWISASLKQPFNIFIMCKERHLELDHRTKLPNVPDVLN